MTLTIPQPRKAAHDALQAEPVQAVRACGRIAQAAHAEGRAEHVRFAVKLILHARIGDEVLSPAALLLGERRKAAATARGDGA